MTCCRVFRALESECVYGTLIAGRAECARPRTAWRERERPSVFLHVFLFDVPMFGAARNHVCVHERKRLNLDAWLLRGGFARDVWTVESLFLAVPPSQENAWTSPNSADRRETVRKTR